MLRKPLLTKGRVCGLQQSPDHCTQTRCRFPYPTVSARSSDLANTHTPDSVLVVHQQARSANLQYQTLGAGLGSFAGDQRCTVRAIFAHEAQVYLRGVENLAVCKLGGSLPAAAASSAASRL